MSPSLRLKLRAGLALPFIRRYRAAARRSGVTGLTRRRWSATCTQSKYFIFSAFVVRMKEFPGTGVDLEVDGRVFCVSPFLWHIRKPWEKLGKVNTPLKTKATRDFAEVTENKVTATTRPYLRRSPKDASPTRPRPLKIKFQLLNYVR